MLMVDMTATYGGQTGGKNTQGTPPPRPGDAVPAGGLDPTQVFASPPPPPPSSGGGQHDDGSSAGMPSQDSGPPPPKKGTKATKEMGYDDEDLRVLGEIGDYRFGDIMAMLSNGKITIPSHPTTSFDEQKFLTFLRGSISLTRDEKWRIIQAVPKLSQFQVDELQKILEEERRKFGELSPKHLAQLKKLEEKHADDWRDLQAVTVQQSQKAEDQQEANAIRKQLGL